jgi:3-hydroxyisobutyrate dehydrogenase-like beta-hydroxyacid dehydrogenase
VNTPNKRSSVGFIGLGIMGTPMVTNLHKAGYRLTVHDLNLDCARQLAKTLGSETVSADTPQEVAERSDVVITMLPNGGVVQEVVFGKQGLASGFKAGAMLLDTSSAEPWLTKQTARRLAERGVSMVDAPVSGAQWGAREAKLVFMAGGAEADIERVRPLLDRMGNVVFHLGPVGSGHAMKCINNLVTAITLSGTAEGLVIGKAYGLDPAVMVDVMNVSTGMSWISQTHIHSRILSRTFDDPFKLELMLKDIGIATALARETGVAAPVSGLGHQLWQAAARSASPGASISEWVRWVENLSGVQITKGKKPIDE